MLEGALLPGALADHAPPPDWLSQAHPNTHLDVDLCELDIESGEALAALITTLRAWAAAATAAGARGLRLVEPPQHLAHTLYKIGALQGDLIVLHAPRAEDGHLGG
ncbi:MAG: hypothetical protein JNM72_16545 [Deltaproteobacteria bacterium]|nr:hypothetical protein [Deltaproteobacteria bacterium]